MKENTSMSKRIKVGIIILFISGIGLEKLSDVSLNIGVVPTLEIMVFGSIISFAVCSGIVTEDYDNPPSNRLIAKGSYKRTRKKIKENRR